MSRVLGLMIAQRAAKRMTMYKRINLTLLVIIMILMSTTGCWDRRELEERVSAVAVSIDRAEPSEEGQPMYLVSVQIPIPTRIAGGSAGGGGGGGGAEAVKVVSSTGFTIANAFSNIQKRLNQELFMGHTRVIAISEDIALEGVKEIIDGFRRDPALRRLLWFLVVEGKAVELLRSDPKLEQIPMVYIMTLIENGARTENIPNITLGRFYIMLSNPSLQPIVNYVRSSKEEVSWIGVSLFDQHKMVANLNSKQSWTLMQLRGEQTGGDILIYPKEGSKKDHMVIRPKQIDTKTNIQIKDGKVNVHYQVYLQVNLVEKNFDMDLSDSKRLKKLGEVTEGALEKEATKLIDLLQNKYKVDPLKLGLKVKAYHFSDWSNMDWKNEFPKADISVSYRVEFRRIGMQMK
jgi:spore germination protein KC